MSEAAVPLAVLGTRWEESERWDVRWRGFLWRRAEPIPLSPVRFLDWTVDGAPLRDRLALLYGAPCTDITFLTEGSRGDAFAVESLRALVLENESGVEPWVQFTDGRAGVLFCPQCGDLACGAVSADVRVTASAVEWRDIAYQDGISEAIQIDEVPAFTLRFDRAQYEATVRGLLMQWSSPSDA
ncbi:hypothetical protein [Isoptericola sp. b408]|uniref:hypothetical protein n=1 Tax=Isoptericola sp. b408 TaxID=3064653 RepID=UPI002713B1A1|nr:hypothetical protein [Isoptericola sp. b408]MDO8149864.1 hypothetical protein [Isoptericola sp. b408]